MNRFRLKRTTSDLIFDGGGELDAVDLVHVGLEVDEAHLGLLELGRELGGLLAFLQLLVKVGQLTQVLKTNHLR